MLKVFLADLAHTYSVDDRSLTIPLNIGYVKAYAAAAHGAAVDIQLFKHPERLLAKVGDAPDIIGLANYGWNAHLNLTVGNYLRKVLPNTLIVVGGPNMDHDPAKRQAFLSRHRYADFAIVGNGEEAFSELVEWRMNGGGDYATLPGNLIWLEGDSVRDTGERPLKKVIDNIPSPYLAGHLDEFLAANLIPLFETNRGCPFSCTFCAWGNARMGQVRRFDLEGVLAEIAYVSERSRNNNWIICDANFGLLPRDLDIARAIRAAKELRGTPVTCQNWLSKNTTERNLQIAEILGDMSVPVMAVQSLDKEVLKNIKRDNISTATYVAYQQRFHAIGSRTYSDLIVPLPGETLESHVGALRSLTDYGVDILGCHNMRLLAGAETNSTETRATYAFKTRWRLIHGDAGIYRTPDGTELAAFEVEESLRSTSTMTEDEVFYLRKLHFLVHLCWNAEVYKSLLKVAQLYGFNPIEVCEHLITFAERAPVSMAPTAARLKQFWEEFDRQSDTEWFDTEDTIRAHFAESQNFHRLINQDFEKLNILFSIVVLRDCKDDFDRAVGHILTDAGKLPVGVLEHALAIAVATFPSLDADFTEQTIQVPANFADLTGDTVATFRPSLETIAVRLIASPKRGRMREAIGGSAGRTLSKVMDTNGIDFSDMKFAVQRSPETGEAPPLPA